VTEDQVVGDRELEDDALPLAVRRDQPDSAPQPVAGGPSGDVLAFEQHFARPRWSEPHDRLHQLVLAISFDAGDPEDLARPHRETDVVDGELAAIVVYDQVVDPQYLGAGLCGLLLDSQEDRPAD